MTRLSEFKRKAILHRQAGIILREDAAHHDEAARGIDGDLSDHEKDEIRLRLTSLLYFIKHWTLETRLAIRGARR